MLVATWLPDFSKPAQEWVAKALRIKIAVVSSETSQEPSIVYNMNEEDPSIKETMWLVHHISKDDDGKGAQHFSLISKDSQLFLWVVKLSWTWDYNRFCEIN